MVITGCPGTDSPTKRQDPAPHPLQACERADPSACMRATQEITLVVAHTLHVTLTRARGIHTPHTLDVVPGEATGNAEQLLKPKRMCGAPRVIVGEHTVDSGIR